MQYMYLLSCSQVFTVLILGRTNHVCPLPITSQLSNSLTRGRFTANMSEFVVVPRLELEVNLEDVNATVEVAVRRLGYDSPTTQQKEAVTAFVKGNDVFVSLPTGGVIVLCVPSFVSVCRVLCPFSSESSCFVCRSMADGIQSTNSQRVWKDSQTWETQWRLRSISCNSCLQGFASLQGLSTY